VRRKVAGGTAYYVHTDGRGAVMALRDSLRSGVSYAADVWGNPLLGSAGTWWKGSLYMGLGLYYMRARWYEARTGRFLSEDPIGLAGGINPYVFAGNDPVSGWDPTGLGPCPPGWVRRNGECVRDAGTLPSLPSPRPCTGRGSTAAAWRSWWVRSRRLPPCP